MAGLLGPGTASRDFMRAAASEHQCPVKGPPPPRPPNECTHSVHWSQGLGLVESVGNF